MPGQMDLGYSVYRKLINVDFGVETQIMGADMNVIDIK